MENRLLLYSIGGVFGSLLWPLFLLLTTSPVHLPGLFVFRCLAGFLVIAAALLDSQTYRLPLGFTISAAVLAVSGEGLFGGGWLDAFAGSVAGFGIIKLAQFTTRLRHKKECLGSGDAVLMLSLGALVELNGLPWALGLATGCAFCFAKALQREKLPFGPYLVASSLTVAVIRWSQFSSFFNL